MRTVISTAKEEPVAWRSSEQIRGEANVTRLMKRHGIATVAELRQRSLDPEWFWPAVVEDLDLPFLRDFARVVDVSAGPEWAQWFGGGKLNLAHACCGRWAQDDRSRRALVWDAEDGARAELSYLQLDRLSAHAAGALRGLGVESGDTVGIYMPLAPATVAALLGCWRIGAIGVPIFSGFGSEAVARRLEDAGARVLVSADSFPRRGAQVKMGEMAARACDLAGVVEHLLLWRRNAAESVPKPERAKVSDWEATLAAAKPEPAVALASGHPALLIYTSGSSGRPKGAVLSHAGTLTQIAKDGAYHVDIRPDDLLCWVTDIGWIMGAWQIVAAGSRGAAVCLVEGAPTTPAPDRIWSLVDRESITVLGVGPSLVRGIAAAGATPASRSTCDSLRILGATGEPWTPDAWEWLLHEVGGERCPIINISGGSEAGGCFLAPLPTDDLKPGTLGGPALGMDVAIFDDRGREVGPGEVGELVCRAPWPGMTEGLWKEPERYLETYWSRFPGIWVHGDWATRDADGFWFLHGRSDDTLNIAGQRLGPAEAEAVLTAHPEVAEAAAVAVPHSVKGEVMWCFVVASGEYEPDAELLADAVAARLGKPFRPERVVIADDLPRTRSAKILRRVVRAIATDQDPGDLSSLENPGSIESLRSRLGGEAAA